MIQSFKDGLGEPLLLLDELFDALRAYFIFTRDLTQSLALSLAVRGGGFAGGTYPDATIVLGASTTTWIEANPSTHTIVSNTTGYTSGRFAIGRATTNAEGLLTWVQDFTIASGPTP